LIFKSSGFSMISKKLTSAIEGLVTKNDKIKRKNNFLNLKLMFGMYHISS
jgi:hypothetical protein